MFKFSMQPLTISGVLKNGWELYKFSFSSIWIWSLLTSIVYIIPPLFGFIGVYHLHPKGYIHYSWWGLLIFVGLLIAWVYFVTVLFHTMYLLATEQKRNFRLSFEMANRKLIILYFATLIYHVAIAIGVALFIFPGVFINVLLVLFLPFIIIENQNIYNAFENSVRMVWKSWWQTFFVLFIPMFISYALRNIVRFPIGAYYSAVALDLIVMTVVMPYYYAVLLVQYHNLKLKKLWPQEVKEPTPSRE